MSPKKKLIPDAGAPVVDNQNTMSAGPRGPDSSLFNESHNERQLWETTLGPDTRRLLPVALGDLALAETVGTMTMLMGRGEAAARRAWIEEHGNEVEADI